MRLTTALYAVVGFVVGWRMPQPRRSERGLSQSAEIAILVGGAALLAVALLNVIGPYVMSKLPK